MYISIYTCIYIHIYIYIYIHIRSVGRSATCRLQEYIRCQLPRSNPKHFRTSEELVSDALGLQTCSDKWAGAAAVQWNPKSHPAAAGRIQRATPEHFHWHILYPLHMNIYMYKYIYIYIAKYTCIYVYIYI